MDVKRLLLLLAIVVLVLGGTHYYLVLRLVRDTELPARASRFGRLAIVLLALLVLAGFAAARRSRHGWAQAVTNSSYVWMGLFFFLFMGLIATYLARLLWWVGSRLSGPPVQDPARRQFFARAIALATGGSALAAGAWGLTQALGEVAIKEVRLALPRLGPGTYRIVQISDVHIGATLRRDWLAKIVARINALDPDVVVITGDLVDGSVADLQEHVAPLGDLRAKEGVFFVTGNHEYYSGAVEWVAHLPTLGIRVLRNERVALRGFDLAGVDDWSAHEFGHGHGADYDKALGGRDRNRALVLLAHQPRAVAAAAKHGVELVLSGHTHGGQLFPWNLFVPLQQPYVAGLHDHEGTKIYVSCGTGFWGPPMRVGAPAEITKLELTAA